MPTRLQQHPDASPTATQVLLHLQHSTSPLAPPHMPSLLQPHRWQRHIIYFPRHITYFPVSSSHQRSNPATPSSLSTLSKIGNLLNQIPPRTHLINPQPLTDVHHQHIPDQRAKRLRPRRRQVVAAVQDLQLGVAVKRQPAVAQQVQQAAQGLYRERVGAGKTRGVLRGGICWKQCRSGGTSLSLCADLPAEQQEEKGSN